MVKAGEVVEYSMDMIDVFERMGKRFCRLSDRCICLAGRLSDRGGDLASWKEAGVWKTE